MSDIDVNAYCRELDKLGISHEPVRHPDIKDAREVLRFLGLELIDSSPTLIMKADKSFIAVVLRGDTRADFKKIKKLFKVKNLRMASPREFVDITGLPVDAARVYNPDMRTLIDTKIFEQEYVMGGSGTFDCTIKYRSEDLKKIPKGEVLDLVKPE